MSQFLVRNSSEYKAVTEMLRKIWFWNSWYPEWYRCDFKNAILNLDLVIGIFWPFHDKMDPRNLINDNATMS